MKSSWVLSRVCLAIGLALSPSMGARADDELVLKDGTVVKGKIVSETAETVTFEGLISGIKATQTFKKSNVEIHRNVKPADAPADTPADTQPATGTPDKPKDSAAPGARERVKAGDFAVLPLKGVFGKDFYPKGIYDACRWCVDNRVTDVVFVLDSDGGFIWAAKEIGNTLESFEGKLHFHVVIKRAVSPSVWLVFNCETIGMTPGGVLSGGVKINTDTGAKSEDDSKLDAAEASKLASVAAQHGHDRLLAEAIMLPDTQLWAVQDQAGKWAFRKELPEQDQFKDSVPLSKGEHVISLETDDAVKFGVARKVASVTDDEIRSLLKKADFKSAGDKPKQLLESGSKTADAGKAKVNSWLERLNDAFKACGEAKELRDLERALDRLKSVMAQEGSLKNTVKECMLGPYLDVIRERRLDKTRAKIREVEDKIRDAREKRH